VSGCGMPAPDHVVSDLTDGGLGHARRELAASLALARPGPPARVPIEAQLSAIDAEVAAWFGDHAYLSHAALRAASAASACRA